MTLSDCVSSHEQTILKVHTFRTLLYLYIRIYLVNGSLSLNLVVRYRLTKYNCNKVVILRAKYSIDFFHKDVRDSYFGLFINAMALYSLSSTCL